MNEKRKVRRTEYGAQNSFINEEHSVMSSVRVRLSQDAEGVEKGKLIFFFREFHVKLQK